MMCKELEKQKNFELRILKGKILPEDVNGIEKKTIRLILNISGRGSYIIYSFSSVYGRINIFV